MAIEKLDDLSLRKGVVMAPMHLTSFNIEDKLISFSDIGLLPSDLRDDINEVFREVVLSKDVQEDIRGFNGHYFSIGTINGKLSYKIDSREFKEFKNDKIQKVFASKLRKAKKYLTNIGKLTFDKKVSSSDEKIINSAPKKISEVSKTTLKKMNKSDSEWSLWAIFAMSIKSMLDKF